VYALLKELDKLTMLKQLQATFSSYELLALTMGDVGQKHVNQLNQTLCDC
jgi:hypothetical protein